MILMPIRLTFAYPFFLRKWEESQTAHFPKDKTKGSERIGFFYSTGMAQSGTHMELLAQYNPESFLIEVERLQGIEPTEDANRYGASLEIGKYYRVIESDSSFAPYILHAEPTFYENEPSWNHGQTCGYALKEETNEILYWVSNW